MLTMEETKLKEDKLDLLLEWEESASVSTDSDEKGDSLDISSGLHCDEENPPDMEIKRLSDEDSIKTVVERNEEEEFSSDKTQKAAEVPDEFQWSEDLNTAIEEALGNANDIQMPVIHSQLNNIIRGLETDSLKASKAMFLVTEVEGYIHKHLKRRESKLPVNHEGFEKARLLIIDGLHAYLDSTDILKKFIETGSSDYQTMAQSFADQGSEFFLNATELMLESEPYDED